MQAVLDVGVMQLLSSDAGSRSWHLPKETEAGPSGCPSSNNSLSTAAREERQSRSREAP